MAKRTALFDRPISDLPVKRALWVEWQALGIVTIHDLLLHEEILIEHGPLIFAAMEACLTVTPKARL